MPITITNESIYGKPQSVEPARIQVSQPQPEVFEGEGFGKIHGNKWINSALSSIQR
jgi:hypothetical protein